jgi:hypothetical protein
MTFDSLGTRAIRLTNDGETACRIIVDRLIFFIERADHDAPWRLLFWKRSYGEDPTVNEKWDTLRQVGEDFLTREIEARLTAAFLDDLDDLYEEIGMHGPTSDEDYGSDT